MDKSLLWVIHMMLLVVLAVSSLAALTKTYQAISQIKLMNQSFVDQTTIAFDKISESLRTNQSPFEATGYQVKTLDDGRVQITFLSHLGESVDELANDSTKEKESFAEMKTVILPAWMWSQVVAEASLKIGFEALKKAKESQKNNQH